MSQLTTNTTTIDECIALANSLPNAGSGGGGGAVETCTVTFVTDDPVFPDDRRVVVYVGADCQAKKEVWEPNITVITVAKGSPCAIVNWTAFSETNATRLVVTNEVYIYQITEDSTMTYIM